MDKLTPDEVYRIAHALRRIEHLDEIAQQAARDAAARSGDISLKMRDACPFPSGWGHRFLSDTIACALINEMMRERQEVFESLGGLVDVPPPPFGFQEPDRKNR